MVEVTAMQQQQELNDHGKLLKYHEKQKNCKLFYNIHN